MKYFNTGYQNERPSNTILGMENVLADTMTAEALMKVSGDRDRQPQETFSHFCETFQL